MRISSPPFLNPCYFGTDVPDSNSLIAYNNTVEETNSLIGADSLCYLSIDALHMIMKSNGINICDACFSGNYPVDPPQKTYGSIFDKRIVNIY